MAKTRNGKTSRRAFLGTAGKGLMAATILPGFPSIVPASVLGANAPSNRVNIGAIGTGRISRGHDLPGLWKHDIAQIVAAERAGFDAVWVPQIFGWDALTVLAVAGGATTRIRQGGE